MTESSYKCEGLNHTSVEVAVLQQVVYKIDNTVAEIAKASSEVSKLLIVHDNRLKNLEDDSKETNMDVKGLQSKMEETTKQIVAKLDDMEGTIESKLRDTENRIEQRLNEYETNSERNHRITSDKIATLEKWSWLIIGGAFVIGYLIEHSSLIKLIK